MSRSPATLAVVACGNGLGHLGRQLRILAELAGRRPEIRVTVHCARWQVPHVAEWADGPGLRPVLAVEPVEVPVAWYDDGDRYGDWLVDWADGITAWGLDRFDLVWSDNLVEPLHMVGERAVLGGSFLWHDVLTTAHPGNDAVRRYAEVGRSLLARYRPAMLASDLFAMPAVRAETAMVPLGLVPPRAAAGPRRHQRRFVVAVGSSPSSAAAARQARGLATDLVTRGWELVAEAAVLELLELPGRAADPAVAMRTAVLVVGRAGLGTVSDAAAAGCLLIPLPDTNPELAHNAARSVELGLAIPASACTEDESALEVALDRLPTVVSSIDLQGAATAAAHIEATLAGVR